MAVLTPKSQPRVSVAGDTLSFRFALVKKISAIFSSCGFRALGCSAAIFASTSILLIPLPASAVFVYYGDSKYIIVDGPTWGQAQANAVNLGGNLVTINDAEEWSWFKSEYSPTKGYAYPESYGFYPNGEVQLWVGINDIASEGQYEWASGEVSSVNQSDLLRLGGGNPSSDDYGVWQWEQGRITLYSNPVPTEWQAFAKNIRGVAEIKLTDPSAPTASVPGPLPILGLAAAFGFSRKLRKRIKLHKGTDAVSTSTGS